MVHEERPKCTKHQNTGFHLKTCVKKSLKLESHLPVQGQNISYTAYLSEEYQLFQAEY